MRISELIEPLENLAPLSLQEGYDNSGLIVGNNNDEISSVLICLDCTEAVVEEAIVGGHGLIIAHHPIVFKGLKKFNARTYIERVVQMAIKNDVALYATHTNLDKVHGGVNSKICEILGLGQCSILSPEKDDLCKVVVFCPTAEAEEIKNAMFAAGGGHIGKYDECSFLTEGNGTFRAGVGADPFVGNIGERHSENEMRVELICNRWKSNDVIRAMIAAHPYEEVAYDIYPLMNKDPFRGIGMVGELDTEMEVEAFLSLVKTKLELKGLRYSGEVNRLIHSVAVCGGSGSDLISIAKARGAQAFITSDIKYHQFFDAENDLLLIDVGHYESERFTKDLLAEILRSNFPKFAIHLTGVDTNPVQHYN